MDGHPHHEVTTVPGVSRRLGTAQYTSIPFNPKRSRTTEKLVVVVSPHMLTTLITPERPQGLVSILDPQRELIGTADV